MAFQRALRSLSSSSRFLSAGRRSLLPSLEPVAAAVGARTLLPGAAHGLMGQVRCMSEGSKEIYVAWEVKDAELRDAFAPFGEIEKVRAIRSRGFGFVTYSSAEDSERALEALKGTEVTVRIVNAQFSNPKDQSKVRPTSGTELYIGNLANEVDEEALKEAFAPFGEVAEARVIKRRTGSSVGYGFVSFPLEEDAQKALEAMNDAPLAGQSIRVEFSGARNEGAA